MTRRRRMKTRNAICCGAEDLVLHERGERREERQERRVKREKRGERREGRPHLVGVQRGELCLEDREG